MKKDENTYLTGVKSIAAGNSFTIFLMNDGSVKGLGWNCSGQLGDRTTENRSYPVQVNF